MNPGPQGWLVPCAFVGYVALAVAEQRTGSSRWLVLLWPLGLGFCLNWAERRHRAGQWLGSRAATRAILFGVALAGATFFATVDSAGLEAARSAALLSACVGALLAIARVPSPRGLLHGHPAAASLDAVGLVTVIWSVTTTAALVRALFPELILLDPDAFDTAYVFSVLGSLLLLCAAEGRVLLLRGLELGVADRARSSLALAIAGTVIAIGTAVLGVASIDRALGATLVFTTAAIGATKIAPSAARVTRIVRATVALLLLGAPVALGGARFALELPSHPVTIALSVSLLSVVVGLVARSLSAPLGPEGSRWLTACEDAMEAALHPEPDVAIRDALVALHKTEPRSRNRPELYRAAPGALLSVDVAGYLSIQNVDFPKGVLDWALGEPELTLRAETLERAQVREPRVRPVAAWFSAHEIKTVTALVDDEGGIGLLALPRGARSSHLALEEAEALGRLGRRLSGLLAVNSALARSRERELSTRKVAESSVGEAEELRAQLSGTLQSQTDEAEALVEVLRVAAHSPRARLCLQDIDKARSEASLELLTPPGVDARPWAAHYHLAQEEPRGPLVVFDGHHKGARDPEFYALDVAHALSPARRARGGTLVLLHLGGLPLEAQEALATSLRSTELRLVVSRDPQVPLAPGLRERLGATSIRLPALRDRPEDLQSLVIFELSRIGLALRGEPFGIDRGTLLELHERTFPGNEDELRGWLVAAASRVTGNVVTARDLKDTEPLEANEPEPEPLPERTRARRAPRSRR